MAKQQSKIRWRNSDADELQRTINNFNAKLYRLKKKNPELAEYLPDRVKKSEVIKSINTRADYNRIINSYKRFSKKGAEAPVKSSRGAKATQWEIDEVKLKNRIDNANRTKQRNALANKPQTSRGKPTGNEVGTVAENELTTRKLNFDNVGAKEWELKKGDIDRAIDPLHSEYRKRNYRLNYIQGLRNAGFSADLEALIYKLPIDKFIEVTRTDTEADIDFIYDPIQWELKQEALFAVWEKALDSVENG